MNRFELTNDSEAIISTDDLTIYLDRHRVERAVFCCDMDGRPLRSCNPEQYGYGLVALDVVDAREGIAIAEVTHLPTLLAEAEKQWGPERVARILASA